MQPYSRNLLFLAKQVIPLFYFRDLKFWEWWLAKHDIITADYARCGGTEFNKKQTNDQQKERKSRQRQAQREETGRGGAIRVPGGIEEAGWSRELEFETHSIKGGLLSHRTRLLCWRNSISHFDPSALTENLTRWKLEIPPCGCTTPHTGEV